MSRIEFQSPRRQPISVHGTERAWLGLLCGNFTAGLFKQMPYEKRAELIPGEWGEHLRAERETSKFGWALKAEHQFEMFLRAGDSIFLDEVPVFQTCLNTCLVFGNAPLVLAALIHGQCEIHGFIEDNREDKMWVADTLRYGMDIGIFRRHLPGNPNISTGWEELADWIAEPKNGPIVSSYSVTDPFPGEFGSWRAGLEYLRGLNAPPRWSEKGLRLFGHGKTVMDYVAAAE